MTHNLRRLRHVLRQRRLHIPPDQARTHARQAARFALRPLLRCRRIALYLANDGELNPQPLCDRLWRMRKSVFLPALAPGRQHRMYFLPYAPDTRMRLNRYRIAEPRLPRARASMIGALDCILLPLVGFDATGRRLGMGGGYYDRALAQPTWRRPYLVGYAHACQEVPRLPERSWDIPLDGVVTERGFRSFSRADSGLKPQTR